MIRETFKRAERAEETIGNKRKEGKKEKKGRKKRKKGAEETIGMQLCKMKNKSSL